VRSRARSRLGFTLIEVMLALAVFALLTVIFATSVVLAKKSANMNGQYAQAISLCQHKIDQLRAVGYGRINYTELNDSGIVDDNSNTGLSSYSFMVSDGVTDYLPSATATVSWTNPATDVTQVTATVNWKTTSYESKPSSVSISALITNVE
jgi:prepilin-type N-terminal cleavage/methylation domain-containing protein